MNDKCVADIEGPWVEPELNSGLIQSCRDNWSTPITQVTNHVLATFIRQNLALSIAMPEARSRLDRGYIDGSELYEDELDVAMKNAQRRSARWWFSHRSIGPGSLSDEQH
ncbi:MAG: hypothetical protein KDI37_07150 [Xanthomonadales bacterium]|nr:hypothetical protein [Xanthomonadales bacterium]